MMNYFGIFLILVIFVITRGATQCSTSQFQCSDGHCISKTSLCNRRNDCPDGSDESYSVCFYDSSKLTKQPSKSTSPPKRTPSTVASVGSRYGCALGDFACLSGECIKQSRTCDGTYDCSDGSDESPTICPNLGGGGGGSVTLSKNNGGSTSSPNTQNTNEDSKNNSYNNNNNHDYDDDYNNSNGSSYDNSNSNSNNNDNNSNKNKNNNSNSNKNGDKWHDKLTPCEVPSQPSNGHWKLHRSLCDSGRECEAPSYARTMEPGTYLVYDCNRGYNLNGNRDVLCGPGGQWIKEPVCDEIKCKYLSDSATEAICLWNNVAVSCEIPVPINTTARLKCRDGFVQEVTYSGTFKNVTCQSDGSWSPNPIKCVKKPKRVKLVLEGDMILED